MALILESEKFEILDVSEIKVEKKLAFERNEESVIPRNEDEAFIREFIRERGGAKIGSDKICQWPSLTDWISIVRGVYDQQRSYWVRMEILKGKSSPPDYIEPDPERDQVTEDESYFMTFAPIERYVEETCYKLASKEQNYDWKASNPVKENCLSLSGVKRIDDFIDIYTDFSKMNGLWISPTKGCNISMSATAEFDDIKDDDDDTQSVKSITAEASYNGTATIENDGTICPNGDLRATYKDANGNERTMSLSNTMIWYETLEEKQIKDGKEKNENGGVKQKYKTVRIKDKRTMDVELWSDKPYDAGHGIEREWKMISAAVEVYIDVTYKSLDDKNESETKRKQLIVKTEVDGRKQKIGSIVRNIVKECLPKSKKGGEMTSLKVKIGQIGWIADIEWNTRIEEDDNV